MSEKMFKKPKAAAPLSKPPASGAPATSEGVNADVAVANINKALGQVLISHGAQTVPYEVAGKSVAYVREALGSMLNLPSEGAQALIDGTPVPLDSEGDTILRHGVSLEFVKPAGVKGVNY